MKPRLHYFGPMILRSLLIGLLLGTLAVAAPSATNTTTKTGPKSAKDAKPVAPEPPVTLSTFVLPAKPSEGKDPFFPHSTRPYGAVAPTKTAQPAVVAELTLGGISGTTDRPLAIINNSTFTTGDELEVTSGKLKLRIRCLEINMQTGSVLVQVGGERRELRLHKP